VQVIKNIAGVHGLRTIHLKEKGIIFFIISYQFITHLEPLPNGIYYIKEKYRYHTKSQKWFWTLKNNQASN